MSNSPADSEHARFESAAIYLTLCPASSSEAGKSLENSVSASSVNSLNIMTPSTSFKRAHSPEPAAVKVEEGRSGRHPGTRSTKRSRMDSNISANVWNKINDILQTSADPSIMAQLPAPIYAGNLDLYAMFLPFLNKVYLPDGVATPKYEELYRTLLHFQAKPNYSARCFLAPSSHPADPSCSVPTTHTTENMFSRFESLTMIDPMTEIPYEIQICAILPKKELSFAPNTEQPSFSHPETSSSAPGPGISAKTRIPDQCGIKSSRGVFKMKRVWAKKTPDGTLQELFEGFFSFNISFDTLYKKAGHGNGAKYRYAFWGIRASKGSDGKEIGLGPRTAAIGH